MLVRARRPLVPAPNPRLALEQNVMAIAHEREMTANPTDSKRRRVVGNGAGIVQRIGRRLTKPQMQVRLPLPASPCPFLNARLLTGRESGTQVSSERHLKERA
jgi:hypothetical protein